MTIRTDGTPARNTTDDPRRVSIGVRLTTDERREIERWADAIGLRPSVALRGLALTAARVAASRAGTTPQEIADTFARWFDAEEARAQGERVETMERASDRFPGVGNPKICSEGSSLAMMGGGEVWLGEAWLGRPSRGMTGQAKVRRERGPL